MNVSAYVNQLFEETAEDGMLMIRGWDSEGNNGSETMLYACEMTWNEEERILIEAMVNSMKDALGKDVDLVTQSVLDKSHSKSDFIFKDNVERDKVLLI